MVIQGGWFTLEDKNQGLGWEVVRHVLMVIGFLIMAIGAVIILRAQLGVPPWDVFHLGLSPYLGLTFGQAIQGVGLAAIVVSWLLGVKPRLGTVLNMFFVGLFVDLIIKADVIPVFESLPLSILQLLTGIIIFAYGSSGYILIDRGTGPRDSLMVAFSRITGWRFGVVRTILEVVVTIAGFFLGGPLGLGTVVFALLVGPIMEMCFKIIRWQQKKIIGIREKRRK